MRQFPVPGARPISERARTLASNLPSLLRAAFVLLGFLISLGRADAGNSALAVSGAPEEPITHGASYYYTSANGTFTVYQFGDNGLRLVFEETGTQARWDLFFYAPYNTALAVGTYENTNQSGDAGRMNVSAFGIGCNQAYGTFVVHELVRELDGQIVAFHISFQESCDGVYPPLVGEVLYNSSAPLPPPTRITNLAFTGFATKGQPFKFQLTSSAHLPVYSATGLPAGLTLDFRTGLIFGTPNTEGVFSVPFTVRDATNSTSASASLQITVLPPSHSHGPYTALNILGDPGEFITRGIDTFVSSVDQLFFIVPGISFVDIQTRRIAGLTHDWRVGFGLPNNEPLLPGTYFRPVRNGFNEPGLVLTGPSRGGSLDDTGSFEIIDYDPEVPRLHARFEYHYEDQPTAVRGTIWYRATNAITSLPQIRVAERAPLTYQIVANNAPTSFAAENLPPGLTLNSATGIIAGSSSVTGKHLVKVSAINGTNVATDIISIFVIPGPPAGPAPTPVMTVSVNAAQIHEGGVARFTIRSSAPSRSNLTPRFQLTRKKASPNDFRLNPVGFVIPAGQTSASLDLHAMVDAAREKKETVTLTLTRGPGYKVGPKSKVSVTILDGP